MSDATHPTFKPQAHPFSLPQVAPALTSDGDTFIPEGATLPDPAPATSRPAIGVYFDCANQYVRVYRDAGGSAYVARCPKCAKTMSFRVAPGGTSQRMFRASCR